MPNRIRYSTNIVKGERRGKRKSHFWIDYAEPYLIYSTNIGKEEGKIKWTNLFFIPNCPLYFEIYKIFPYSIPANRFSRSREVADSVWTLRYKFLFCRRDKCASAGCSVPLFRELPAGKLHRVLWGGRWNPRWFERRSPTPLRANRDIESWHRIE